MKKLIQLCSVVISMVVLFGCAAPQSPTPEPTPTPTPEPGGLTLESRVQKESFEIGDQVVVTVRASETCFLQLFNISADGQVARIFPNSFASNHLIQGGQMYHIPSAGDGFVLQVSGPRGTEHIRAIATLRNVEIVGPRELTNEAFPRFQGSVQDFEQALEYQLSQLDPDEWASANVSFTVQ